MNQVGPGRTPNVLFVQDQKHYRSRVVPRLAFLAMVVTGALGATAVMLNDLLSDPSYPRTYYLVPVVVWAIFLEILLVVGWELSRSRFIVWSTAFVPPFRRSRTFGPGLPPVVAFENVGAMTPETITFDEKERVHSISVELASGERLIISEGDVSAAGVDALQRAWRTWIGSVHREPIPGHSGRTPAWVGREWRTQAVVGSLLVVILVLEGLLVFSTSSPGAAGAAAMIGVVLLGSAFGIGWTVTAWSRKRSLEGIEEA